MKVVFFEDVEGTAEVGDVKDVKNGFARNFLLPRGIAGATTRDNLSHARALAEREARRQAKLDEEARKHTPKLEGYTVSFEARVGETGRLFGSVTSRDIAEKLTSVAGVEIESRQVLLAEPIRELGIIPVNIKFTRNVSVEVNVEVGPDEDSKEIVAKLTAQREAEAAALRAQEEAAKARAAAAAAEAAGDDEEDDEDEDDAE
jgi:large subunit ribosomal protein L9